jgi:hypothetical protein
MKFKTTKKNMRQNYHTIITIGYCDAQYLLQYENPIAYSTRAEGWACDYYDIDNVLITTGYAPLSEKNSKRDYDIMKKYDNEAMKIVHSNIDWKTQKEKIRLLLNDFINEVKL